MLTRATRRGIVTSAAAGVTAAVVATALAAAAIVQATHPISGRPFARVMGYEGADWLDRPERLQEEQPERALDAIAIPTGASVADVGAGTGYFTVRLSRRVGRQGRVYATDIQREMLARLDRRLKAE